MMLGSALLAFAQPVISPAVSTLPDGRVGSLYSYAFSASGGTAPYSFTLSTGTLPSAMGLSTSGLLSGTPGSTFTGALRVQVRDAAGLTSERTVSLRILDSLSIATVGFPSTILGATFSQCLSAQGGSLVDGASNGTWSIVAGALPPGITITSRSPSCGPVGNQGGALSGIPTVEGIYVFTLQAADTLGQTAQRQYTLTILSAGPITVTPTQIAFTCQVGAACSVGAFGVNIGSGGGTLSGLNVSVSSTGGNWLQVIGLNTSTTPASLQVFVDPAVVTTAGVFQGSITIRATAAAPVTIPVTLTAVGQVTLSVSSSQLSFTVPGPGTAPPAQTFTVTSSGPSNIPIAVNVTGGFPYVVVTQSSDQTPAVVTVRINITGLALGITQGNIQITGNASNSPVNIPVSIASNPPSALTVFPQQLAFNYATGSPSPQAQGLYISSTTPGLEFTTTTTPNTPWLVVANTITQTPGQAVIAVNPVGLSPGTRTGSVIFTPINGGGPIAIPVVFTITTAVSNLVLSPPQLNFNFQIGGGVPQEQTVAINSTSADAPLAYTAAIHSNAGATWLRLSGTSGTSPGFVSVGLNTQNLNEGVYSAQIVVRADGAGNNPQTVPVSLTVTRQFSFSAAPSSLNFTAVIGSAPQTQAVQLTAASPPLGFLATSSSTWLTVSPNGGNAPTTMGVSVNPQGLGPGTYAGNIQVSPTVSGAGTITIPVTLTLTANSQLRVSPTALQFTANEGIAPAAQPLQVTSTTTPIPYTVFTSTSWIGLSTTGGTTPGSPLVSVLPQGLGAGFYRGEIRVSTTEPGNVTTVVPVTYTVTAAARVPQIRAMTNAASLLTTGLVPLMVFTVFGDNLGPDEVALGGLDGNGRLPRSIAGVRLLMDGSAVPLLYVSKSQASGIVPSSVAGQPNVAVQAEVNGTLGTTLASAVVATSPALFTADASGRGQAAALNEDGGLNGPITPISVGSILVLYATGTGELAPRGEAGAISPRGYGLAFPLTVEIDGQAADVLFAGQAPGQIFGLTQINVRVPETGRRGALPVVLKSPGYRSLPNVTIEVR